jgi:hypothetical protein
VETEGCTMEFREEGGAEGMDFGFVGIEVLF